MIHATPYADDDWETVEVFPSPTPLVVHQWATDKPDVNSPPYVVSNEPVFAFFKQRRLDVGRLVPSVLDRCGNVRAVEPGSSWRHFTLVIPPDPANVKPADEAEYHQWLKTRDKSDRVDRRG